VAATSQEILNGTPVDPAGGAHVLLPRCSGYLLNNEWMISAKHCYLDWGQAQIGSQYKYPSGVITHPTLDLMLQRVESPFEVGGSTRGHNASFYQGTRSDLRSKWVNCYGYGVNTLGQTGFGTLRSATLMADYLPGVTNEIYVNENASGQLPFNGDSGSVCIYTDPSRPDCVNGCVVGVARAVECYGQNGVCEDPFRTHLTFSSPIMTWLRSAFVTDALFVQVAGSPTIYLMQGGAKFPIPSWEDYVALRDTWGYSDADVRQITQQVINAYPPYPRDGSFVQEHDADPIYVMQGGYKFHIPNPAELQALQAVYGWPHSNVKLVPSGGLAAMASVPANGTFLRERNSSAVYLIVDGAKYWVPNPDALVSLTSSYRKTPAHVGVVPPGALAAFPNRATP
jgi:hypothetical protein